MALATRIASRRTPRTKSVGPSASNDQMQMIRLDAEGENAEMQGARVRQCAAGRGDERGVPK
jgi:hypothetical protein